MLFLVKGVITKTEYMEDVSKEKTVFRLVEAETAEIAGKIYVGYYHGQSDPYGTHISAQWTDIEPVLTIDDLPKEETREEG